MFSKTFLGFATVFACASIGAAHPAAVGTTRPRMGTQEVAVTHHMAASSAEMPQMVAPATQQSRQVGRQEPTQLGTEEVEGWSMQPQQAVNLVETPAPAAPAAVVNSGVISGYFPGSFVSDVEGESHVLGISQPTANVRSPGRVYAARRNIMAPERMVNPRILSPGSSHRGQVIEEQSALANPRIGMTVTPSEGSTMMEPWTTEVVEGRSVEGEREGVRTGRMQWRQMPVGWTGREAFPGWRATSRM